MQKPTSPPPSCTLAQKVRHQRPLSSPFPSPPLLRAGKGFTADDGATLLMAFRGLQAESVKQGEVHKSIAHELNTLVLDPFHEWATAYQVRTPHSHPFPARRPDTPSPRIAFTRAKPASSTATCAPTSTPRARCAAIGLAPPPSHAHSSCLQVSKLKHQYLAKVRKADEAEDE